MGYCYLEKRGQKEMLIEPIGIYEVGIDARPSGNVTVPNKVKTLATRVFQNDENITSIKLPPYLNEIQEYAFQNCKNLLKIDFPQSLQIINQYAFDGCVNLTTIDVPNNISILKPKAFGGNNINELILKENFAPKLWDYAYANNQSINSADVNCYLISKGCFSNSNIETLTIGNFTKILKEKAFENCKKLTNLNLSGELLEIGDYCFFNTNLQEITIPKSIQKIGEYCFSVNKETSSPSQGLKKVIFQEGLKTIGQYSFYDTELSSVIIPKSVQEIGSYAFGACEKLLNIQLEDGIKQLGIFDGYALADCGIEQISIPTSVEKITKYCFFDCKKLKTVELNNNIEKSKLEEGVFKNCISLNDIKLNDNILYLGKNMFESCTSIENITLPKNLEEIDDYCFLKCSGLKSLDIPSTIKRIGKYCFQGTSIGTIKLPRSLTTIEGYAFSGCTSLGAIEFDYFNTIEEIPVEEGLITIKSNAFYDSVVNNLNIPYTIKTIEKDAFKNMVIDTLHIDVIKTQEWLDVVNTWGMKSCNNIMWRQSILNFDTNVDFFELYISQDTSTTKIKVDTKDTSYIFEPLNEGITLHYWAYAPNMVPIIDQQFFNRIDRENYKNFTFTEQSPYKIQFLIKDENGEVINDAQVQSDTIFEDFAYTYQEPIYYVNKGTNISYTVLKSGYGAVYGTIENVIENKEIEIQLSKNGYTYIDLKYPFKENQEYLRYLLDDYNFKSDQNFGEDLNNCIYSDQSVSSGYIKFKTPNDIYAQNTIKIEGYLTMPVDVPLQSGKWNSFYIIFSPNLQYKNLNSMGSPIDLNSNQIIIGQLDQRWGFGITPYKSFNFSKTLSNLKPNTVYYILIRQATLIQDVFSDSTNRLIPIQSNKKESRLFIKRITFNSCSIEDTSSSLPTIISGDKVCLYDGIGKTEAFVNEEFFNASSEYGNIIFKDVFNIDLNNSVYVDNTQNINLNCYGNRLCKAYSIQAADGGFFDAGIFKLIKPINCDNYSKIKITCILTHDWTSSLMISSHIYVGQEEDVKQPIPKESYDWSKWGLIGEISEKGQNKLFTYTYDISQLSGVQELFIGIYHGTEISAYTAQCYIVELELQ